MMESIADLINNVTNQFIVRPAGSNSYIGSKGFVFDIIGDEESIFDAEITDHFVEKNYSIQDHISLRPPKFTLSGYVGELNDLFQNSFINALTTVQSLGAIGDYTPSFSLQATQFYQDIAGAASQIGVVLNQATNVYQLITGESNSRQQASYDYFIGLYMNRTLCTVETPWAVWKNMAIESLRIIQKDDNKFISEFSVTFKQIRVVATSSYRPMNFALNGAQQIDPLFMNGRASDSNIPFSFTSGAVGGQAQLDTGATVDTDLLSGGFSLPTLEQLEGAQ
jgi:hypothetical protein